MSIPPFLPRPTLPLSISSSGSSRHLKPAAWYQISIRTFVLFLLPFLSLLGLITTWGFSRTNGTFASIISLLAEENAIFPGSDALLVKNFTRIRIIDHQLSTLVALFAPVVDSSNAGLSLFALAAFGQFGAVWTVMVMESLRMGNYGKAVSFIGITGLVFQNISLAVTGPLWLFLHLLTSPVAKPFPGAHANTVLICAPLDLTLLPISITIGYILPSLMMILPSPETDIPSSTHQKQIAFWQLFPLWTILTHGILRAVYLWIKKRVKKQEEGKGGRGQSSNGADYLGRAKHVYRFVIALCIFTHLPPLILSLIPSYLLPTTFPLTPTNFLTTYLPTNTPTLTSNIHNLLIYNLYISSLSFLLWATLLYHTATMERNIVDPNTSLPIYRNLLAGERSGERENGIWWRLLWKVGGWGVLSGPMGVLAVLLWDRDEIVRRKIKQGL